MISRRELLRWFGSTGIVAIGGCPPAFLCRAAWAAQTEGRRQSGRVLVLVQLAGGNDGLNTVIPYADPEYAKARPGIGIGRGGVLRLDDHLGLHPRMTGMRVMVEKGVLAIVQGVGYPNPSRSHFRSMDIWHSARPDAIDVDDGWIGRSLDARADSQAESRADSQAGTIPALALGTDRLPLALLSSKVQVPTIRDPRDYRLLPGPGSAGDQESRQTLIPALAARSGGEGEELAFLRRATVTAVSSARRLEEISRSYRPAVEYPRTGLAEKLKVVAQLIASDIGTEIYFVSLGGFDTHAAQAGPHANLLGELSGALHAFHADLAGHKLADRVLVATFSEFGRRVKENASLGTDHGAASPLFIAGGGIRPGIHGRHPSLTQLDQGDLVFHTDFRSVYATLLERWLGQPSQPILGQPFPLLDFV